MINGFVDNFKKKLDLARRNKYNVKQLTRISVIIFLEFRLLSKAENTYLDLYKAGYKD